MAAPEPVPANLVPRENCDFRANTPPVAGQNSPNPSQRSLHALDWPNFFVSDVRTGVGPFVAVYLTQVPWDVMHTGVALPIAELAGCPTRAPRDEPLRC